MIKLFYNRTVKFDKKAIFLGFVLALNTRLCVNNIESQNKHELPEITVLAFSKLCKKQQMVRFPSILILKRESYFFPCI